MNRSATTAANVVMTMVFAAAVSIAMLPMITVKSDATSTITKGHLDQPAREMVMEPEDRAAFPQCVDIREWPKGRVPDHVLVIESNGDRLVTGMGEAFARVEQSKQRPELSIWVIGACR